jgi:lactate permease
MVRAWTPFLLLILCVGNWGMPALKGILDQVTLPVRISSLSHIVLPSGKPLDIKYNISWLSASGTSILIAAGLTILLLRIPARQAGSVVRATLIQLRNPMITIGSIVAFAYLTNYSGMAHALGNALTVTGHCFPLVSPVVGWLGVFVSGSDTSSNALFSNMQKDTAVHLGVSPILAVCANSVGGVTGKMISPQSIAVACGASNLVGQEGQLFRMTIPHSLGLLLIVSVITYLQAYYLTGMIPMLPAAATVALKPALPSLGIGGSVVLTASLAALAALVYANSRARGKGSVTASAGP